MSFWRLPAHVTEQQEQRVSHPASTRLSGRWLTLIRFAWLALVVCILVYFIASLPAIFVTAHQPCAGAWCTNATGRLTANQMHALVKAGISLDAYAWSFLLFTGITSLVWFGVAGILFWRKSDDWVVLLVAFMLIAQGVDNLTNTLEYSSSFWRFPENVMYLISGQSLLYVFALFPNGRLVPRWTFWVALAYPTYAVCYLLFLRPLRVPGWTLYNTPLNAITWFGSFTVLIVAQLYRYFRVSTPVERQQTKWVALGFFVVLVGALVLVSLGDDTKNSGVFYAFGSFAFPLIVLVLPLSIGFAMLRSHLWDIDVIISRALVYGALTLSLALVYFGLVLSLELLIHLVNDQAAQSPIIVVASTLAIAALFNPLRHRFQALIDRRFYRKKYDAEKTLATFSATLRNEIDLATLSGHLLSVVQETMQPAHVSLWLRPPGKTSSSEQSILAPKEEGSSQ